MFSRSLLLAATGALLVTAPVRQSGPVIFLPNLVSTAAPEFAIAITPDGRELYFNRASANRDTLVIMVSRRVGTDWSAPVVASFSGRYRDVDPFAAPDGRRLYFSSNRPRPGEAGASFNTWYLERRSDGWSAPIPMPAPFNTDSSEVFVSVARDGSTMFSSNRDGPGRIYLIPAGAGATARAIDFGGFAAGSNPLISPDGKLAVFVKEGPADRADLHVSCRTGERWSAPVGLTAANSRYADFAPAWDPTGQVLYFTSERPGLVGAVADSIRPPGDIYAVSVRDLALPCGG